MREVGSALYDYARWKMRDPSKEEDLDTSRGLRNKLTEYSKNPTFMSQPSVLTVVPHKDYKQGLSNLGRAAKDYQFKDVLNQVNDPSSFMNTASRGVLHIDNLPAYMKTKGGWKGYYMEGPKDDPAYLENQFFKREFQRKKDTEINPFRQPSMKFSV
jgi:hypothetical protein